MPIDLPIVPINQTFKPNTKAPKDLTHLIDAFQSSFGQEFDTARRVSDEGIIGNSRANAAAAKNRANFETSQQDTIDQTGQVAPNPNPAPSNFNWSAFSTPELEGLARQWGILK